MELFNANSFFNILYNVFKYYLIEFLIFTKITDLFSIM